MWRSRCVCVASPLSIEPKTDSSPWGWISGKLCTEGLLLLAFCVAPYRILSFIWECNNVAAKWLVAMIALFQALSVDATVTFKEFPRPWIFKSNCLWFSKFLNYVPSLNITEIYFLTFFYAFSFPIIITIYFYIILLIRVPKLLSACVFGFFFFFLYRQQFT